MDEWNGLLVLLDLSTAFNMVDHNILPDRLENWLGFSDTVLKWFIISNVFSKQNYTLMTSEIIISYYPWLNIACAFLHIIKFLLTEWELVNNKCKNNKLLTLF